MTVPERASRTGIPSIHPLLTLHRVSTRYGNGPLVLDGVDLTVRPADFVGIVGPSGAGKTTLLRVLLGIARIDSGEVVRKQGLRIGYVPQLETIDWNFPVTAFEVVLMAAARHRRPWASAQEKAAVQDMLERLGIAEFAGRHIRELSGGQQQRVFIARALFSEPDLLIMDEPTSGVDVRTRHEVLHLLSDLSREGLAVVVSTHDLNGIAAHLPHIVCLQTSVVRQGKPIDVLTPEVLEKTYGAPMQVLQHMGIPLVIEGRDQAHHRGGTT